MRSISGLRGRFERHVDHVLDPRGPRGHHDDPVGEVDRLGEVARHEQDRLPLLFKQRGGELFSDPQPGQLVEGCEGLVEEEDGRVGDKCPGHSHALLHATGHLVREPVCGVTQPHRLQRRQRPVAAVGAWRAGELKRHLDVAQLPSATQDSG